MGCYAVNQYLRVVFSTHMSCRLCGRVANGLCAPPLLHSVVILKLIELTVYADELSETIGTTKVAERLKSCF
jgi:hypothetical protein